MLLFVGPLRRAASRFSLTVLLVLSVVTMILGRADVALVERVRGAVDDFFAPVLMLLRQPVQATTEAAQRMRNMELVYAQNGELKLANAELLQWQDVARRLATENAELRGLLNYQPQHATWFVTARVIGTAGGAFSRNLLIDRGREDNVARGQAALTGTGLAGRISEVGSRTARVLMLTDLNSRIPVLVGANHERAILAGDNSDRPVLLYLPSHATVQVGDRVFTSGDGGVLPPDLPVGVVAAMEDGQARVEPMTDLSRVEYVRISDFGLSGVLPIQMVPAPTPKRPQGGRAAMATLPPPNPPQRARPR